VNVAAGTFEDDFQHAGLEPERFDGLAVLLFQRGAVEFEQRFSAKLRRNDGRLVVRRLGKLIGHLEKQQHGELLHVFHTAQPACCKTPA